MDIRFGNKKLKKYAHDDVLAQRKLGQRRAELFKRRLDDLYSARSLEDLRYAPGHYHELVEDRKGQWACDLDQPYRLIFKPQECSIPTDNNGQYIWHEIKGIEIVEIIDYHGK